MTFFPIRKNLTDRPHKSRVVSKEEFMAELKKMVNKLRLNFQRNKMPLNRDYCIHLLQYSERTHFETLVFSRLTKTLEFPDDTLDKIRGEYEEYQLSEQEKLKHEEVSEEYYKKLEALINHILPNIHTEGVFRKPGNAVRQRQLEEVLEGAKIIEIPADKTVHDCIAVLKKLLYKLKEPLLVPSKYFGAHLQISRMQNITAKEKLHICRLLMLLLPADRMMIFKPFLKLLNEITMHSGTNKMTSYNLGTVILPTILCPRDMDVRDMKDEQLRHHLAYLIDNHEEIFEAPEEVCQLAINTWRRIFAAENNPDASNKLEVCESKLALPSCAIKRTPSNATKTSKKETKEHVTMLIQSQPQIEREKFEKKMKKLEKIKKKEEERKTPQAEKRKCSFIQRCVTPKKSNKDQSFH